MGRITSNLLLFQCKCITHRFLYFLNLSSTPVQYENKVQCLEMVNCDIKYISGVANGKNMWTQKTKGKKRKKRRYGPLSYCLNFVVLAYCYYCKSRHSFKLLSLLCKHFKTVHTGSLWQLMIHKIQLTVCKHKKAVRNEKEQKQAK